MPQVSKGGKFIFGISHIWEDLTIQIPKQAIHEYALADVENIILITGSKATGGFCITTYPLLSSSKLCHILTDCPQLREQTLPMGKLITYKGRGYTWLPIGKEGVISLPPNLMRELSLQVHSKLLAIRSSNIAFTMGAKGPLWEKVHAFNDDITQY